MSVSRVGNDQLQSRCRSINERIRSLSERAGFDGDLDLVCECAQPGCFEIVRASRTEYDEVRNAPGRYLLKPGHVNAETERIVLETRRCVAVELRTARESDQRGAEPCSEPSGAASRLGADSLGRASVALGRDRVEVQTERLDAGIRVVSVRGTLDLFTAPRFEQELLAASDGIRTVVIVDLSQCDYLDSGALAVIMRRFRFLDEAGSCLLFVAPHGSLLRLSALARLDGMVEVHPTRATALSRARTLRIEERRLP